MSQRYAAPLLLLIGLVLALPAQAQTTYTVTVENRTSEYPDANGWSVVYAIDGTQGQPLTLVRGETYVFQLNGVSGHPFYISTNATGGGAGVYSSGVENGMAQSGEVTFTVPMDAPDELYYQCGFHPRMGGLLNIVTSGTASEREGLPEGIRLDQNYPNPFNPSTEISFTLESGDQVTLTVFDALGRTVKTLLNQTLPAGEHSATWDGTTADGSEAPSGTYLYRLETADGHVSRSMTLVR